MTLTYDQKQYVKRNHEKLAAWKMAWVLGVTTRELKRWMKENGLSIKKKSW